MGDLGGLAEDANEAFLGTSHLFPARVDLVAWVSFPRHQAPEMTETGVFALYGFQGSKLRNQLIRV